MARGAQDIGNGYGYVYQTAVDGTTITAVTSNNNQEVNNFKPKGNVAAPFASKRSSYGTLTVLTIAATGSVTDFQVNGVSIIAAPIVIDGMTQAQSVVAIAAAINGYTPLSGPKYQASAIEAKLLLLAPSSWGATPNGYAIVLSDSGAVFTYSTESFSNGSDQSGVYDSVAGSRYFLNADYGSTGTSGELPADPESLTNSIEITKYFVTRGQNLGIISKTINTVTNALVGVDRSGFMTKININPETGTTETVTFISPEDFVDGDIVVLQANVSTDTITVESAPVVTVPVVGNIRLTDDSPWISNAYTALVLQYRFIDGVGGTFMEMSRSLAPPSVLPPDIMIGATLIVSSLGSNATAIPYDLNKHYSTFDAALSAAAAGDTIVVFPGAWTCSNVLGISTVANLSIFLYPGATITGGAMFNGFRPGFRIYGGGDIVSTGINNMENDGGDTTPTVIKCNKLTTGLTTNVSGGTLYIECATSLNVVVATDPLGVGIFSMVGTLAAAYNTKIIAPEINFNITAGGFSSGHGFYFEALPAGSKVEIIGNINNLSPNLISLLYVYNMVQNTVIVRGDIIDQTSYVAGNGSTQVVAAQNNDDWGTGSDGYGFYIYGNILTKTRFSFSLSTGRVDFYGNIVDFSDPGSGVPASIYMTRSFTGGSGPSFINLNDGKAKFPAANGVLFKYVNGGSGSAVGNVARLKNFVAVVDQFLAISDDAAAAYELLSAYSTKAADATVINSITGTTLVVDAAIT